MGYNRHLISVFGLGIGLLALGFIVTQLAQYDPFWPSFVDPLAHVTTSMVPVMRDHRDMLANVGQYRRALEAERVYSTTLWLILAALPFLYRELGNLRKYVDARYTDEARFMKSPFTALALGLLCMAITLYFFCFGSNLGPAPRKYSDPTALDDDLYLLLPQGSSSTRLLSGPRSKRSDR